MARIIDVRGGGNPVLGRLRGVTARHEIRTILDLDHEHIYFKPHDAHLRFRGAVPSSLPDALSNAERQLVVSKRLAEVLREMEPKLEIVPVRLVDRGGATVSEDRVLVAVHRVVNCVESDSESIGGYIMGEINKPKEPKRKLPAVFRIGYSLAIACNDDAAGKLAGFSGLELVPFASYVETLFPFPPASYEILRCGTEGADLGFPGGKYVSELEQGQSLAAGWPKKALAKMQGQKSRKKVVDFTGASGAPVITAKAKAVLDKFGTEGVEVLPVQIRDHGNKAVAGDHWVWHVTATRDYVDIGESDIEVVHGKLWTAREIVVDDAAVPDKPPWFRVPGARYPWVFVRTDVIDAMCDAKLSGFRTEHPANYAYSVEGGGVPHIS